MWIADNWKDFEVLDCGGGEKAERWDKYILVRPDPQAIWPKTAGESCWKKAGASYQRSASGGGKWEIQDLPDKWQVRYGPLIFQVRPMNFKHTGLFPEQAANWDTLMGLIQSAGRPVSVLNLFAYTGGATLACAAAGASVCHVDAAKGMVQWARENAALSGLQNAPVRWIVDDCKKFVEREIRRGRKYDAIIMDPPSYGRGPTGEMWKIEDDAAPFIALTAQLLSDNALFFFVNSYSSGLAPSVMGYILGQIVKPRFGGSISCQELGLPVKSTGMCLPCGNTARWISANR